MNGSDGVLLFGGAFNPPHRSHHRVLRHAQAVLPVSQTLILPTGHHPLKDPADLAPAAARLELCQIAFGELPGVTISDLDTLQSGPAYTIDTLAKVQTQFPGRCLFWLLGADNLRTLDQWHEYRQLLDAATLVTIPRIGARTTRTDLSNLDLSDAEVGRLLEHVLDIEPDEVSATAIRNEIRRGQRPAAVEPAVMDRILDLELYST